LIDQEGENIGVVSTKEAWDKAREAELDLVEVSPGAKPPVARIMDYNKYLYDQKSKAKKSKTKKTDLKEFQFGSNIGEGDLKVRIDRGREFLKEGNMVKYTVKFKGRANLHPTIGMTKLKIIESELSDVSKVEKEPRKMGSLLSMTLIPA